MDGAYEDRLLIGLDKDVVVALATMTKKWLPSEQLGSDGANRVKRRKN